ncbi:gag-proteinase polyprotein [Cucumis melo var. makuwa]|uniref:Gag-proteinase polyprotein n=1 Tax=Cucumis melo var. makuwa TaxID=1194695 RepID=A0A5D3DCW5_CUCMM|nr:gag-proteinase polyprotein [Cucumis melo var. makuwa]TYK21348.1 gag-proteinase polyprotein [Cucumis melo var. makuwa]
MEIIREGPSTSRPLILDGKNYSYWKSRMIFFIKTLDGRAWRALVAGYEPPMIIVDGVSVPKPEVDWTDAEEQASIGNARAINAIFNDVDLNVFKLINSCSTAKEAWRLLEVTYEGTSKYNERVLEDANESLLLDEKIPDSKIVQKVLQSLPRKFEMNVTAIEEAHDITTLELDELFGSLLTLEMAISDKENKKGKGIAFKSIYQVETIVNQSDDEANMDESIALLKKQFSKVVRKFKNMNTIGSNAQNPNQYRRKDGENTTRRYNKVSNRRGGDYGKKKGGEGRFFKCRECRGVGHYQIECPTFLRRQKKSFRATLSDEDTDDSEDDSGMNAFTACITKIDLGDESECSKENCDEELTFEELKVLWKEDSEAKAIQKEIIQDLMEENERLMSVISSLKLKLKEVQNDYDQTIKFVKMLNSGTKVKFVPALVKDENETTSITTVECASSHITFGDGARSRIIAKEKIDKNNLPCLNDVRYVDGLKANLNSVSQLCDQEAVNTACHIHNRITTRSGTTITLYELWKGRKPNVKYFHVFGRTCYILADREYHRKSGTAMETINVVVNDFEPTAKRTTDENDEAPKVIVVSSTASTKAPKADT